MPTFTHIRLACPYCGKWTNAYKKQANTPGPAKLKCEHCHGVFECAPSALHEEVGTVPVVPSWAVLPDNAPLAPPKSLPTGTPKSCPKCKASYAGHLTHCPDCHVPLAAYKPPSINADPLVRSLRIGITLCLLACLAALYFGSVKIGAFSFGFRARAFAFAEGIAVFHPLSVWFLRVLAYGSIISLALCWFGRRTGALAASCITFAAAALQIAALLVLNAQSPADVIIANNAWTWLMLLAALGAGMLSVKLFATLRPQEA